MSITVKDLFQLEKMHDAEVIAGKDGLKRVVGRIATIEKPFSDHLEYSYHVAQKGDLYLSKLHVFVNEKEKFYGEIHFMIDTESSGLVVHRSVAGFVDEFAINLAEEHGLPIIVIDDDCGFAELTYSITDMVIRDKTAVMNQDFINKILLFDYNPDEIRSMFLHINSSFKENGKVVYVMGSDYMKVSPPAVANMDFAQQFLGGILYIFTSKNIEDDAWEKRINQFIQTVKRSVPGYKIGVSGPFAGIEHVKGAIKEAIFAGAYADMFAKGICHFPDLGIYKLFVKLKDEKELLGFRNEVLAPLEKYEKENNISLLNVLSIYLQSDGSYKKIADELFIHETTARYRMHKIYEILNVDNKMIFYTNARIAILIDTMLKSALLKDL